MVDPIAGKATSEVAATRVAAATPIAAMVATASPAAPTPTPSPTPTLAQTSGLARTLAATPPVDADRVATIKKAIADGRFPILPATIADRLIALKLQWHPDDAQHDPDSF